MIGDMTTPTGNNNTMPGQVYTILSWAKSMNGLKLCAFNSEKIKVNTSALEEMQRMKATNSLIPDIIHKKISSSSLTLSYLNIRSLREHYQDLLDSEIVAFSKILCLSETKIQNYINYQIKNMTCFHSKTKHGSAIYVSTDFDNVITIPTTTTIIETVAIIVSSVLILSAYIPPATSWPRIQRDVKNLIQEIIHNYEQEFLNIIFIGDFNVDLAVLQKLTLLLKEFGLKQHLTEPTHELGSILDLVFTNLEEVTIHNIPVWFTDHHAITLQIK